MGAWNSPLPVPVYVFGFTSDTTHTNSEPFRNLFSRHSREDGNPNLKLFPVYELS